MENLFDSCLMTTPFQSKSFLNNSLFSSLLPLTIGLSSTSSTPFTRAFIGPTHARIT